MTDHETIELPEGFGVDEISEALKPKDAGPALAPAPCCASCNAYEDRLEEIRMAVSLDRYESNTYEHGTIEHGIWELRQTVENLRKQNRHDRKQWKHEVREQRKLRKAAEKALRHNEKGQRPPTQNL